MSAPRLTGPEIARELQRIGRPDLAEQVQQLCEDAREVILKHQAATEAAEERLTRISLSRTKGAAA